MNNTSIKIDRLEIRLKGVSPQAARVTFAGIGNELMEQFAKQNNLLKREHTAYIEKIDSGTMKIERNTNSSDLRRLVAARIANSVGSMSK
jgi:hypothetical protein